MKRAELKEGMLVGTFTGKTFVHAPDEWIVYSVEPHTRTTGWHSSIQKCTTGPGVLCKNVAGVKRVFPLGRVYPLDVALQLHREAAKAKTKQQAVLIAADEARRDISYRLAAAMRGAGIEVDDYQVAYEDRAGQQLRIGVSRERVEQLIHVLTFAQQEAERRGRGN